MKTNEEALEKVKSDAQIAFETVQKQVLDQCGIVKNVQIIDETSCNTAIQITKDLNTALKIIDAKRTELKAPFLIAGLTIDEIANQLIKPAESAIKDAKARIKVWDDAQIEKNKGKEEKQLDEISTLKEDAQAKRLQLEATLDKIIDLETVASSEILNSKTVADLGAVYKKRIKAYVYTGDESLKSIEDNMISRLKSIGSDYKKLLERQENNDPSFVPASVAVFLQKMQWGTSEDKIRSTIAAEAKPLMDAIDKPWKDLETKLSATIEIPSSSVTKRMNWKYEVTSQCSLPLDWIILNEKKIKKWMKARGTETFDGEIVNGVKFTKDSSIILT